MTDPAQPDETNPASTPDETVRISREEVTVRRSPRVWRILTLGAGAGAIAAFIATFALPETPGFSKGQIFGFLLLGFVVIFVGLAALVVILLDRLVGRRTRTLQAERVTVTEQPPEQAEEATTTEIEPDTAGDGPGLEAEPGTPEQPAR